MHTQKIKTKSFFFLPLSFFLVTHCYMHEDETNDYTPFGILSTAQRKRKVNGCCMQSTMQYNNQQYNNYHD